MKLYRNGDEIHSENIFGINNRSGNQKTKKYTVRDQIVKLAQPGDTYSIYGLSGGGGGHTLEVDNIWVLVKTEELSGEADILDK